MNEYIRVKNIGQGSFGKALLVKSKKDGMTYVIKEINVSKMKVLSEMKHPNIVSYMDSFEENGNLYIVMDYCEGGDLYKKINSQRGVYFTEDQVLDWFVQIALAIKHVHDRKILHRDIKTQNIFLTRSGTIKLGDFGIARVLRNTMELARTCIGTPYYLSPEICENRPYNNKSDLWSLGCVLYEMLTLKHAFEAGNMKNLALKIIKGSYPPVPPRYSAEVRMLVSRLFKRNPRDRPSINTLLRHELLRNRIDKFLSEEMVAHEFSHTVLHKKPFHVPVQKLAPGRPIKPAPVPKKISKPAAKYGVSVAKKAAVRKPSNDASNIRKPVKPWEHDAAKAKELDAREKRRLQLQKEQEDAYNKMMNDIQRQRWQKQQIEKINKARQQNWLKSGNILSPEKKQRAAMKKYQNAEKENQPNSGGDNADPQSISTPAWQAVKQGRENRAHAVAAANRAKELEEFWQRKLEAAANKNRNLKPNPGFFANVAPSPAEAPRVHGIVEKGAVHGNDRNREEQNYLAKLDAIRKQNYHDRIELQQRMAKLRAPVAKPLPSDDVSGDPRIDPDARKKKIAALKAQAEKRFAVLKEKHNAQRLAAVDRYDRERKAQAKISEEKETKQVYQRPTSELKRKPEEAQAVGGVGLETALKHIGAKRLSRSHSEGDLASALKKHNDAKSDSDKMHRKQWEVKPFESLMLPLEVTGSAMEATTVNDVIVKPTSQVKGEISPRSQWNHDGKTQLVSALEKVAIQVETLEMPKSKTGSSGTNEKMTEDTAKLERKIPVAWVAGGSGKQNMGVTKTLSKDSTESKDSMTETNLGVTIVKNHENPTKETSVPPMNESRPLPPAPVPKTETLSEEDVQNRNTKKYNEKTDDGSLEEKLGAPMKAWEEQSLSMAKKDLPEARSSYENFLLLLRNNSTSPKEEKAKLLLDKVDVVDEDKNKDDMTVEDVEEEPSLYQTAEMSYPSLIALTTGKYDADVKSLRTCSMPDIRLLFQTNVNEDEGKAYENDEEVESIEEKQEEEKAIGYCAVDDDPEEEVDIIVESDEESKDYFSMLESMEDVLVTEARSPSPIKMVRNTHDSTGTDGEESDSNDESPSSTPLPLNEDWDSGESGDEDGVDENHQKVDEDSVFGRLEESRQTMEDQLGFSRFMKVYKYIQSIQENDDDVNIGVGPAPEIADLLGEEYEHLYPKILYLVMADFAYCEDND
ncbi:serine/threonine-protein kinase Nek1-like isoform X2 [Xenia sp. Carnegie-2017]|uniref:serine/threonine-protein kinase Nek1-like isoform X2 n=1 Tax=Xenia sp. Carnegie-2017 TaxID=2897299 RepID=UPI001F04CC62|nr:serine/threonine-protein kinase Nek1-like isoform X2 [Xenia sp. Carnegie-2017]